MQKTCINNSRAGTSGVDSFRSGYTTTRENRRIKPHEWLKFGGTYTGSFWKSVAVADCLAGWVGLVLYGAAGELCQQRGKSC